MERSLKYKIENINLEELLGKKGYAYFTKGWYNLNIIGVRSKENHNNNSFDDFIIVEYNDTLNFKHKMIFPCTTNPGTMVLINPSNPKGCAILVEGQYRGCWTIGKHKGKYEALVQCKPVAVFRDNNKDLTLDTNKKDTESGLFGINFHKAGNDSKRVDNWSEGCQVFKKSGDFDIFMQLVKSQIEFTKCNTFTYTLLNEKDLDENGVF